MRTTVLMAIAAIAGSASGQNLLNNPGFESDLGFDFSDVTNWNGFFGGPAGTFLEAFNTTGTAPLSGAKALELTIQGAPGVTDGFNAFTGHVQTVFGITPGAEYELSIWARSNGNVANGAEFRIEWLDAFGTIIGDQFALNTPIQNALTSEYQQFSISAFAPANAARANAVIAVQSFLNNGVLADISIAVDDASLTLVPAPASAALLALGGFAASRRRRA